MSAARRCPVVLLHALSLDASMWQETRGALEGRGHQVVAPHQRGFGGTPLGPAGPSLDVVADDLARTLDAEGIERAVLVGASMGGYTAMAFLRRHPGRALGLALVSTRATADDAAARTARERFAAAVTDPERGPALVAAAAGQLVGPGTRERHPALAARVAATAAAAEPAALAWAQRAIAAREDCLDVLRATDVPAVVITGQEDTLIRPADAAAAVAALPSGRWQALAGAGHLPPLETPGPFRAELDALLGQVQEAAC
ncbi:alpha/beta hydrolase [Streptomyces sp. NPDC006552]|uniref:alpha/beta fold hydrolase n=1 Tax=Streptomyces sp. NPDC006552 TaxID=3157179 RepID=UPI0033AFF01F